VPLHTHHTHVVLMSCRVRQTWFPCSLVVLPCWIPAARLARVLRMVMRRSAGSRVIRGSTWNDSVRELIKLDVAEQKYRVSDSLCLTSSLRSKILPPSWCISLTHILRLSFWSI
jgi:hypothetical protein